MVMLYSVINPFKEFSKATYSIPKGMASMERIDTILTAENSIAECSSPAEIGEFTGKVEFENGSFTYDGGRKVLDNVSLTVAKGKTVAIVGESGAGKTTLVDLIPRFYDVFGGSV